MGRKMFIHDFIRGSLIKTSVNRREYKVSLIGRTTDIYENYFEISAERKIKHPSVKILVEKDKLFFESKGML